MDSLQVPAGLTTAILVGRGVASRADALDAGVGDDELRALVRGGAVVRVRRGFFADGAEWSALLPEQRHLLVARAYLRNLEPDTHLAHVSALVAHGCDLFDPDLSRVHVVRERHSGRKEAGCRHSVAELLPEEQARVGDLRACTANRALVDYARDPTVALERAVVAADSLLHQEVVNRQQLEASVDRARGWCGSRGAVRAVALSDGRSESVGESRCRVRLAGQGLAPDDLQREIGTSRGTVRCDFAWTEHATIGEFDGMVKYGRLLKPHQDASQVLVEERRRELAIERAGWVVVRFTWADLGAPARMAAQVRDAFQRAARLSLARVS